jgi:uncharacterized protein YkwD
MFRNLAVTTFLGLFLFGSAAISLAADSDTKASADQSKASDSQKTDASKQEAQANDSSKLYEVEKQMLEQTNAKRAKYGLPPLVLDQSLEKTTRSHAVWMTNTRNFEHSHINVGENIAEGQRTPTEAFTDWMNSPGHRANILNSSYKRTGVAAYQTPDGTIYWCQQFLP